MAEPVRKTIFKNVCVSEEIFQSLDDIKTFDNLSQNRLMIMCLEYFGLREKITPNNFFDKIKNPEFKREFLEFVAKRRARGE